MSKPRIRVRPNIGASSYTAGSHTHPDLKAWNPLTVSGDSALLPELGTIVNRSQDLIRNSGIASSAEQTIVDNVVGTGLRLNSSPDYRLLGMSRDEAEEWGNQTEGWWHAWADTQSCSADDRMTFADMTGLVVRSIFQSGSALAIPLWNPEPGEPFALRMQIIDPDRLSNPDYRPDTDRLRGGIELDSYGRAIAYHVRTTHPGDGFGGKWQRIPAKTAWGRRRAIYISPVDRPGQTRGRPSLTSVMRQFKVLGDYQHAELKAALVNAMVAMVTETQLDQEGLIQLFGGDEKSAVDYLDSRGEVHLKDGLIVPLMPGEKLNAVTPARPAQAFPAFTMAVLRHIATGLNIPYELLMKDFSQTNYSSARAAMLEAWRFFKSRRSWLAAHWARPVYELWMEEAVSKGYIEAPDFYARKAAWTRARWIGPGRGWIDPVKEATASKIRMEIGISTLEDECAEQGQDWGEVLEQRAREKARINALGLSMEEVSALPEEPDTSSETLEA